MQREWTDELGRDWLVWVDVPDVSPDLEVDSGDAVLVFEGVEDADREIEALGPLEELFDELTDRALQHALDAAGTGEGRLLADRDSGLWWVRGPEAEVMGGDYTLKFSDGSGEGVTYEGPLPDELEVLTEDQLLEMLDEARGRVITPMDQQAGVKTS